jgi:two-component system NtrC family sensor kinase
MNSKKIFLLLFFLLLLPFLPRAEKRDSLLSLLKASSVKDTTSIRLYVELSKYYFEDGVTDSALYWCEKALLLSHSIKSVPGDAQSTYLRGRLFLTQDDYLHASQSFIKAQELFKSLGDKSGIADCYLQMGVLMYVQKNYNEALHYFYDASPLFKSAGNLSRYALNLYLTGLTQYETGDYKSALPSLLSALSTQMDLNDEQRSMECRMAIAQLYFKTHHYNDAMIFYRFIQDYYRTHDNHEAMIVCLTGIGNVQTALNQDAEAEKNYLEALAIANTLKMPWRRTQVTEPLYKLYEKKGDFKKAFEYQKLFHQSKDSLFTEQNMQAMAGLKSSLDIAKKQSEIDTLNQQEEFDKKIKLGLVVISVLLVALLAGLWRRFRFRKKVNEELAKKNKVLDDTLHHLKAAEQQLIKAEKMAVFGKLSAGIAHEIRNPLNFITNFSELTEQIADDFTHSENQEERNDMAQQLKKLVDKIGYHGRRADSIVTRMLQHSRSAHTEMELTDVNRLANEFSDLAYESMRNLITNFECKLDKELDPELPKVWLVPQDLSRVIINLLNNAFYAVHDKKHMQFNGYIPTVTIRTSRDDNKVMLSIHDNGAGIPEAVKTKIFEPFFTTKPMGEGTGLGLSICADIVKAAHGDISVASSPETGTEFKVVFPASAPIKNRE